MDSGKRNQDLSDAQATQDYRQQSEENVREAKPGGSPPNLKIGLKYPPAKPDADSRADGKKDASRGVSQIQAKPGKPPRPNKAIGINMTQLSSAQVLANIALAAAKKKQKDKEEAEKAEQAKEDAPGAAGANKTAAAKRRRSSVKADAAATHSQGIAPPQLDLKD